MHHKRLEHMKETLMCAVEMQLCNLGEVDTKELGEAIDMIKDLEEAIYYCTVTKAMETGTEMEWEMKKSDPHHENGNGRMYYPYPKMYNMMYEDDNGNGDWDYPNPREGKSPKSRRMYMEAKEMKKDKATQLRELEKYMQELSSDITEMIADASVEEKQYLEKKITALASKIGQMK